MSRQYRTFLMLELLIALTLVATCALPLAQFPMKAMREEISGAYRMHTQRLADLAFAEIKEDLHKEKISWKDISRPKGDKAIILDKSVDVFLGPKQQKKFLRLGTIHSVGKKGQNGEEWRLATIRIKITPEQKGLKLFRTKKSFAKSRVFTYQVLLHKAGTLVPDKNGLTGEK